jgi:copper oxidase (laccase) domain-containing protein
VQHGVGQLRLACNSRPEDLIAAIGPAAAPCCYSVGEELYEEFTSQFTYANQLFHRVRPAQAAHASGQTSNHPAQLNLHLDLFEANRRQLLAAGLKPQAIRVVGGCTNCHPELFYSHRLSKGRAGRLMAAIGVFPE